MDIRKLQRAIVDGLEDVKAQHIVVFNTEALSPLFERVIVASGTSNRQTKALAASVRDAVKSKGFPVMSTEGEDTGEWVIVDCGAAVVHIMQPNIRDYYRLEELWGAKKVALKSSVPAKKAPAKPAKPANRGDQPKKATPKPTPAKSAPATPAKKVVTKKAVAKKAAPRRAAPRKTASS
jgi:ribosome-associated protein